MGLYLMGFYNVSWVLAMSLISSNTAGATKKSLGSVSIGIFYGSVNPFLPLQWLEIMAACANTLCFEKAVGNIIGPQFFLDSQRPHYTLGIGAMIFSFLIMAFCGIVYRSVLSTMI